MKELFVNTITEDHNGIIHGIAASDKNVIKCLHTIYGDKTVVLLVKIKEAPNEAFYFFDKFCQFIIYFQYFPSLGLSMKFTDLENNYDLALDEYLDLLKMEWKKEDRDKITQLFEEIKKSHLEKATLIIEDPI